MPSAPQPVPALSSARAPRAERFAVPALVLLVVAAALVRLPRLSDSLWFDEIMYSRAYYDDPGSRSWLLWKDVHPPLYALLLWLWSSLFGNHEAVLRLPSYLSGLASVVLTWALARRWFGHGVALLAAALLAFSPPHIWFSTESKANLLALFLSLLAIWSCARAVEPRATRWRWAGLWLSLFLALATHAYVVAVAGSIVAWLGWRAWHERRLRWPSLATVALLAVTWVPLFLWKTGAQGSSLSRSYLRAFSPGEMYRLLCVWFPHGNTIRNLWAHLPPSEALRQPWPYFLVDGLCALVLILGLGTAVRLAWRDRGTDGQGAELWGSRMLLLWLPPALLAAALLSLVVPRFTTERNFLVILPAYAILLALGALRLPGRWAKAAGATAVLGLAVAGAIIITVKRDQFTVHMPKVDWRAASAWLLREGASNGKLVLVTTSPTLEAEFYVRRPTPGGPTVSVNEYCKAPVLPVYFARQRGDTFWLVKDHWWVGCWGLAQQRIWGAAGILPRRERHFFGLDFYEFVAR